jgi:carbon-monoxide dehydrogenase medium subunit
VKAARFDYVRASTAEMAVDALARGAVALAGGQSLIPLLNTRTRRPEVVVDVSRLPLTCVEQDGSMLMLGALTRLRAAETSPVLRRAVPLLAEALTHVGHVSVRNRGTVGGSVAHADPAAELPAVFLALDAVFTAQGPSGTREVEANDFFRGPHRTALASDELLTGIRVPLPPPTARHGIAELSRRPNDLAITAVFTLVALTDRVVTEARIAPASPWPVRRPPRSVLARRKSCCEAKPSHRMC